MAETAPRRGGPGTTRTQPCGDGAMWVANVRPAVSHLVGTVNAELRRRIFPSKETFVVSNGNGPVLGAFPGGACAAIRAARHRPRSAASTGAKEEHSCCPGPRGACDTDRVSGGARRYRSCPA